MLCELIYSNGIYENVVLILVLMEDALRAKDRMVTRNSLQRS